MRIHHAPSHYANMKSEYAYQYERVTECVECGSLHSYFDLNYLLPPCPDCGSMKLRLRIGRWVRETKRVPWWFGLTKKVVSGKWVLRPL